MHRMFPIMAFVFLLTGNVNAETILSETFDDFDPSRWTITKTPNGDNKNATFVNDEGKQEPALRYRSLYNEDGSIKPRTVIEGPLIGDADVARPGVVSPALMFRVGEKSAVTNGPYEGVVISRAFDVASPGLFEFSADIMAIPYVPYWMNLTGGLFEMYVNGSILDSFEKKMIGVTTAEYGADRSIDGAVRRTLRGLESLEPGEHTLSFAITRNMMADPNGPAQLIDNIAVAARPLSAPSMVVATPTPAAFALLASAMVGLAAMARRAR